MSVGRHPSCQVSTVKIIASNPFFQALSIRLIVCTRGQNLRADKKKVRTHYFVIVTSIQLVESRRLLRIWQTSRSCTRVIGSGDVFDGVGGSRREAILTASHQNRVHSFIPVNSPEDPIHLRLSLVRVLLQASTAC